EPVRFDLDMPRVLAAGGYTAPDSSWDPAAMRIATTMGPAIISTDLRPMLPKMKKPLLAIAAARDPVVLPAAMTEQLARYGGPKRIVVFEKSDHMMFLEEPERFMLELRTFIDGLRR